MKKVTYLHSRAMDLCGLIPDFLWEDDPRPAALQIDERYQHGGGWSPVEGWRYTRGTITYPGDDPLHPVAKMFLPITEEQIFVYQNAWIAVVQKNGEFAVARLD